MAFVARRFAVGVAATVVALAPSWSAVGADALSHHTIVADGRTPSAAVLNQVPAAIGAGEAVTVVASGTESRLKWVSATPLVCHGGGRFAAFYAEGPCVLSLYVNNKLLIRIRRTVEAIPVGDADAAAGVLNLTFDANASKISKVSKATLAEYKDALDEALGIIVMGHSTNYTGAANSPWAMRVSMRRAQKVAAYIAAGGARRAAIDTYWFSNRLPVSNLNQRENRRVTVVWVED